MGDVCSYEVVQWVAEVGWVAPSSVPHLSLAADCLQTTHKLVAVQLHYGSLLHMMVIMKL